MCKHEKLYLKAKGSKLEKRNAQNLFKEARNKFDKNLRKCERNYKKHMANNIESLNGIKPQEFWKHIQNLGPTKKQPIPMINNTSNVQSSDVDIVLNKWKNDFYTLYNNPNDVRYDKNFYDKVLEQKSVLENSSYSRYEIPNDPLNKDLTLDELENVIAKLKTKKSIGCDKIPNEVIKNKSITSLLLNFFQKCFDSSLVPSVWLKSIITPIPKNAQKDPYTPLNYRGISLLSCVSKVYSSLINNRIQLYCNMTDMLVDEQNGFRSGRSCEEHIFTLIS